MRLRGIAIALLAASVGAPDLSGKESKEGPPVLHQLYATAFSQFKTPDSTRMKRDAVVIELRPAANKAWAWQCVLRVLMQKGPVVALDLEQGLVAAPPLVAQLDAGGTQLRVIFLEELYRAQGSYDKVSGFDPLTVQVLLREFFRQVRVQCEGDLRLRERWKYLQPSSP